MIHIFQIQNSRGCQYFTSCSVVLPLSLIPCKKRVPVSQSLSDTLLSAISVDQYYFSYFGNRSSTHITDVAVLWGWKYLLMCISEVLQIFRINCRVGNKVGWLCSGITATPSLHLLCLGAKKESVYFGTLISIHNDKHIFYLFKTHCWSLDPSLIQCSSTRGQHVVQVSKYQTLNVYISRFFAVNSISPRLL